MLALTFTRRAANELRTRLHRLGIRDAGAIGTFHAVALAQLRRFRADRGQRAPVVLSSRRPLVAELLPVLDSALGAMPIVLERSYRGDFPRPAEDLLMPYLDAVEAALEERYELRRVEDPSWPLWIVLRRKG